MKINPALFWVLLSTACILGFMIAGLFRAGLITRLEQEKRDLARLLAVAVNHPSSRRLHAVPSQISRLN
jgi:hypothetical protein